ncbi:MAG: flagellar biosynthesis protein FlhA [Granulosicoccus sp.]
MNLEDYLPGNDEPSKGLISRTSDLFLALLIVAIVSLMILPLPTLLIDTLVAINIAVGLMLVLMGIYISSSLQFSAFPSVLLISTLFRLALSVATTRLILLHGDAGDIITTFGSLVAGGNLVVGLVVFLIITLVQFLVIAKGAERVAEVGARFTLDAMPGKQLSIDSDLRSGLLDKVEARKKRSEIELESKLHGSMDGAMKFVKGDAIAGIIIIIINLLGGLTIGIFQLGMGFSEAAAKYSILTIGDGLVSQIPALLGAMAAGLIVTRATDSQSGEHLGDAIQSQFTAIPRVLLVAGGICLLFSLVPGFPSVVFILIGMFLIISGALLVPALRVYLHKIPKPEFGKVIETKAAKRKRVSLAEAAPVYQAQPLLLEMSGSVNEEIELESVSNTLAACIARHQDRTGMAMPEVKIRFRRDDSPDWLLHAFEVPIARGTLPADSSIDGMVEDIDTALRRNGTLFLGIQETSQLLSIVSVAYPDVVKEVLRSIPAQNLANILRNLVEDEISIKDFRGILEGLLQAAQHEKDLFNLTEFARMALMRQTCYRYAPDGKLTAIVLSSSLEEKLNKSLRASAGVQQLSLDPATTGRVRKALIDAINEYKPVAVLASVQLRRHIRALTKDECFDTPVLSYNELIPAMKLDVLHQVVADEAVKLASV